MRGLWMLWKRWQLRKGLGLLSQACYSGYLCINQQYQYCRLGVFGQNKLGLFLPVLGENQGGLYNLLLPDGIQE